MGKRMGVTKSGRIMNPADRERKQMRLKELKRNKKERVKIRQTIVKSRDPQELIDHMERLDDQEFDLKNELALNVIADKRGKYKGAFIQMIALYRTEKDDKQVKDLETMLHDYELGRFKKEQHYKAQLFSTSADPDDIPLPTGLMAPNAALTPFVPPPVAPQFHATMKAGILKKSTTSQLTSAVKKHKYPPGPPCGLPPRLYDEEDNEFDEDRTAEMKESGARSRRVHFTERKAQEDEDYGPVDIPEGMLKSEASGEDAPPPPQNQPVYSRGVPPPQSGIHPSQQMGTLIPPGMAPLPPRLPPGFPPPLSSGMPPGYPPMRGMHGMLLPMPSNMVSEKHRGTMDEPNSSAVISAAPQVNKPSVEPAANTATVISAAPQMRNLKKETTRFVPTTLRVTRPAPPQIPTRKLPAGGPGFHPHKTSMGGGASHAQPPVRSADEACDEFLKEIQDLL